MINEQTKTYKQGFIYIYVFQQNFQEQKNSTFTQKNFNLIKE
jgi:hypothetical protein